MADLLGLSAKIIDENIYDGPRSISRMSRELSEVAEGVSFVEAFSNIVCFDSGDGLVLFDTSLPMHARDAIKNLRAWSDAPVHSVAYTHGHVDHVGGMGVFVEEAASRGDRKPRIIGHKHVADRFDRYDMTNGYNAIINGRQFGPKSKVRESIAPAMNRREGAPLRFGPKEWQYPDTTFDERMSTRVGNLSFDLRHAKGETDDHLWAYIPEHKAICVGDFFIWVFPNAGNPQKVQRYPMEWARALRDMIAVEPELMLPAHGLPIAGKERIRSVLDTMASALEDLLRQSLEMMNAGARLNDLVHGIKVDKELLAKPYLRPIYDEPEFIINNIWRLYGGWYDGNPAHLKPAADSALATELATLSGGASKLAARALELLEAGDLRLASHLAEMAALAEPENLEAHKARAEVFEARRNSELTLMARGIYGAAAEESAQKAGLNREI